ncbi:dihydrodipicolinate synthase family protein [Paenibacillus lentus]|uniref:Dihydrodipicolinate synthase family protein n=1 Tax=Paenibacillus lentus TaxID=1338368 RepID=A0A3Q8SCN6_9BACL|nr:dihydrodipicolinate synthase family protein [Paenibacillus lentus]AZK47663.1 dihydrodipicolinate synthase family protein [Paenibacillus lentus]
MWSQAERVKFRMQGGLIPAVPVPRYANGKLHKEAQTAYAAYLTAQRIAGVAVWVHTGRGLQLQREQRRLILQSWKAALQPEQIIVAGVGAVPEVSLPVRERIGRWRKDSIGMAEEAIGGGADALLVFPPLILRELPVPEQGKAIVRYHTDLAELGVPIVIFYLYEEAGGWSYDLDLLRELLLLPHVIGVKIATLDSVMTMQAIARLLTEEFPNHLHITGEDRMFGYALMRGAHSALVGLGAAFPNIQADLITAYQNKNYARFMDLSERIDGFAEATFTLPMDKYILRMLHCLAAANVIPGEAANDIAEYEMTEQEIAAIRRAIMEHRLY